jgi:sugar phosphate isomerase/epimerase
VTSQLTVLNMMASRDFDQALTRCRDWGLHWIDLWGDIYGCPSVDDLDVATAARASQAIERAGIEVYCLSTRIFNAHVEVGEAEFRALHLGQLRKSLELADILKPRFVRLIAGRITKENTDQDAIALLKKRHPWVVDVYREVIDAIVDAGFAATIENETTECFLATPDEFLDFFEWLDRSRSVSLTWDIQNNWEMGVVPSLDVYRRLRHLIGYVHLKGGQAADGSSALAWRSGLEDASWPVIEIASAVVADGSSPVICLNPSHGAVRPGYDTSTEAERDLSFLRRNVPGL